METRKSCSEIRCWAKFNILSELYYVCNNENINVKCNVITQRQYISHTEQLVPTFSDHTSVTQ